MTKETRVKYRKVEFENPFVDKRDMERLIYFLSVEENSVLLLRHMGYQPEEICEIVGITNMIAYRKLNRGLNMRIFLFKNLYKE